MTNQTIPNPMIVDSHPLPGTPSEAEATLLKFFVQGVSISAILRRALDPASQLPIALRADLADQKSRVDATVTELHTRLRQHYHPDDLADLNARVDQSAQTMIEQLAACTASLGIPLFPGKDILLLDAESLYRATCRAVESFRQQAHARHHTPVGTPNGASAPINQNPVGTPNGASAPINQNPVGTPNGVSADNGTPGGVDTDLTVAFELAILWNLDLRDRLHRYGNYPFATLVQIDAEEVARMRQNGGAQ